MLRKTIILTDIEGMHARNSARVVMLCKDSLATVTLTHKDKAADGRNILELMSLGALCGDEIVIAADGPQEEETEIIKAVERALNG